METAKWFNADMPLKITITVSPMALKRIDSFFFSKHSFTWTLKPLLVSVLVSSGHAGRKEKPSEHDSMT